MSIKDLKPAILLRAARNIFNLSLNDVGAQVDVSAVAVRKWENGETMIKTSTFGALQKYFMVNGVKMILDEDGEAVIRVNQSGIERISQNPKNPELKSLEQIYKDEQDTRIDPKDFREMILVQIEKEMERDPLALQKLLPKNEEEEKLFNSSALGVMINTLLSSYRTEGIFGGHRVMRAKQHPGTGNQPRKSFQESLEEESSEKGYIDPLEVEEKLRKDK